MTLMEVVPALLMSESFLLRKDFGRRSASRPRGEAQAVCARITLNPLFATIVSWQ